MSRRWIMGTVAATAVVVLLLVVANGSGSLPVGTQGTAGRSSGSSGSGVTLGGILRLVYLGVLASALYRWLLSRDDARKGAGLRRRGSPALTLLMILVIGGALILGSSLREPSFVNPVMPRTEEEDPLPEVLEGGEITDDSLPRQPHSLEETEGTSSPVETLLADPWLTGGTLALVGGALLALLIRRPSGEPEPQPEIVPGETAERTRPSPPSTPAVDSRSRVFAAYSEVERAARVRGIGRGYGETVTGHLRRLGGGPAKKLGELYDLARFSPHEVDSESAEEAERAGRVVAGG